MKFLMDQNSVLVENMGRKPTASNLEQPSETSHSISNGQRIFLPEFSSLMTSVSQITSQNYELLKMARLPGNEIGMGE